MEGREATRPHGLRREASLLRAQLVDVIRASILEGEFAPGERLPERALRERYDVSRGLLREALQQLAAEALVELVPHRGPRVAVITPADAREIFAVRAVLEGLIAAAFARNADEGTMERLGETVALLAAEPDEGADPSRLVALKNAFYATLATGAGNRVAERMLTQLNNRVTLLRRVSLSRAGRLPQTKREIAALLEAIRRRDADAARTLSERHVERAADAAIAALEETGTAERTASR